LIREGAFLGPPWKACLGPTVSSWCPRRSSPRMPYLCLYLCITTGALVGCVAPLGVTRGLPTCVTESNEWEDNVTLGGMLVIDMASNGPHIVLGFLVGDFHAAARADVCTVRPCHAFNTGALRVAEWLTGRQRSKNRAICDPPLQSPHAAVEQLRRRRQRPRRGRLLGRTRIFKQVAGVLSAAPADMAGPLATDAAAAVGSSSTQNTDGIRDRYLGTVPARRLPTFSDSR